MMPTKLRPLLLVSRRLTTSGSMMRTGTLLRRPVGMPPTSRTMSSTASSSSSAAIVELREYEFYPSQMARYQEIATQRWMQQSSQRQAMSPLRCSLVPDTGGILNQAFHLYHFAGGYPERDKIKAVLRKGDPAWQEYSQQVKECCIQQRSKIFVEAPLVVDMDLCGLAKGKAEAVLEMDTTHTKDPIFEIRRYQLQLGYDTVPKFLQLYSSGLPSKLQASGTHPTTTLVTLLYTEVGQLNEVIEVWRHGGGTSAMEISRIAAREAQEWRTAIGEIASIANVFTNYIYRPYPFSNIR